jgi:hypothetical protein
MQTIWAVMATLALPAVAFAQQCEGGIVPCAHRYVSAGFQSAGQTDMVLGPGAWSREVRWNEPMPPYGPGGGGVAWQNSTVSEICMWTQFQSRSLDSPAGWYQAGTASTGFESVFEVVSDTDFILFGTWTTWAWFAQSEGVAAGGLQFSRLYPTPEVLAESFYDPDQIAPPPNQVPNGSLHVSGSLSPGIYRVFATSSVAMSNASGLGFPFTGELTIQLFPAGGCRTDVNRDGAVDGDDVIRFFDWWDSSDHHADFNVDGVVDGEDVIGFIERWDTGC